MTVEEIRLARQLIPRFFARLQQEAFEVKSPRTTAYNCIGWAVGDDQNWWWPGGRYWPDGIRSDESIAAFAHAFGNLGYERCDSAEFELGFEKVALYVDDRLSVTHAVRQLPDGRWTSKLGPQWDINHSLEAVSGPQPGLLRVAQIMRRPVPVEGPASWLAPGRLWPAVRA